MKLTALNIIKNSLYNNYDNYNHIVKLSKKLEAELIQKSDNCLEDFYTEIIDKNYLSVAYKIDDKTINKIFKLINQNLKDLNFFIKVNQNKVFVGRCLKNGYYEY